ncbi:intraflagellar transport protein 81 homolog isoform X1 [Varroa jacobsoni]|uniref:intraflagellar transport protein 81 homolog isoform X1 n=1 Tax=Varroa jacobsoni TaxID=62625 RepID=UPI000BF7CE7F|nr:intraflagellar transport protein 81 homolog isoform X1 [Varroa jacobsoni]XP_022702523.1 intraflagellar transport protein 81 homolog isoform X1 [Varroa jacobsoni]
MTEQVKFVLARLNEEPFNKNLNLISLDALRPEQLLQLMFDVFAQVDPKVKSDVRTEDAEQLSIKALTLLRIIKYKPPTDISLSAFRQGLVMSDKGIVYHILYYVLAKLDTHKKRAYLSRYLMKVEITPDLEGDADLVDIQEEYEKLMDQFKLVHKEYEALSRSVQSSKEIQKDMEHMEEERQQLGRKMDRVKRKVSSIYNRDAMLKAAASLRREQERAEGLAQDRMVQQDTLNHTEQKINRLTQMVKIERQAAVGATPETLLSKLMEEVKANGYLVHEKLPKEIRSGRLLIKDLQRVVAEPAMSQADLDKVNEALIEENTEVGRLYEKKMRRSDPDEKQTLFRQQAAIVSRKKEAAAEQMETLANQLAQLQGELEDKRQKSAVYADTHAVVRGEEFKQYVTKLRSKTNSYKQLKQELEDLRAETDKIAAEEDELLQKEKEATENLIAAEHSKGVGGYFEAQNKLEQISSLKARLDEQKGVTLEEMSHMVEQLNAHIAAKKTELAPLIKELKPLRQKILELHEEYEDKKNTYNSCAVGLDTSMAKLELDVQQLREQVLAHESRFHLNNREGKLLRAKLDLMIKSELAAYKSSDPKIKKQTYRERINLAIQKQVNTAVTLDIFQAFQLNFRSLITFAFFLCTISFLRQLIQRMLHHRHRRCRMDLAISSSIVV